MTPQMLPPIAASRTTALATETRAEDGAEPTPQPARRRWTLGDTLVAGLSALSLGFAIAGVVIALR